VEKQSTNGRGQNGKASRPAQGCAFQEPVAKEHCDRIVSIEARLSAIEQTLREQSESISSLVVGLTQRNASLDRLTSLLVVSDRGVVVENKG
jgi:hypothetical protein